MTKEVKRLSNKSKEYEKLVWFFFYFFKIFSFILYMSKLKLNSLFFFKTYWSYSIGFKVSRKDIKSSNCIFIYNKNNYINRIPIVNFLICTQDSLRREEKKIIRILKDGKVVVKYEEIQKESEEAKLKTGVIEQDEGIDISLSDLESNQTLMVPSNIQEQIEKIILKILYDEKSVKSLKMLTEKVLEGAVKERITISEKPINLIIYQMNSNEKIEFTQKYGWKIRI